jgi:LEA14-like dessication related protein
MFAMGGPSFAARASHADAHGRKSIPAMKLLFSLLATALVFCGCSRSSAPTVSLVTVHFKEATLLETTAVFTLRLDNDAPAPLEITGASHKLYLNGLYVGKGLSDATMTLPRLSSVTNNVTVHLSNLALATRVKAAIESKRVDYRIQSTFYGKSWLNRTSSESTGKLDMQDFMPTPSPDLETNAPPPAPPPPKM